MVSLIMEKRLTSSSLYALGNWGGPLDFHLFGGIFSGQELPAPKVSLWEENKEEWHCIPAPRVYAKQGSL